MDLEVPAWVPADWVTVLLEPVTAGVPEEGDVPPVVPDTAPVVLLEAGPAVGEELEAEAEPPLHLVERLLALSLLP